MVARGHMVAEPASEAPALREEWATMEPALSSGCQISNAMSQAFLMHSTPVCVSLRIAREMRQAQQHGIVKCNRQEVASQVLRWQRLAVLT